MSKRNRRQVPPLLQTRRTGAAGRQLRAASGPPAAARQLSALQEAADQSASTQALLALQRYGHARNVGGIQQHKPVLRTSNPVVQLGGRYGLVGVTDETENKADRLNLEAELRYAAEMKNVPAAIINLVFEHVSNSKLEDLPNAAPGKIWDKLIAAHTSLGADFGTWIGKAGLKVVDIPGMDMLLSDASARGAHSRAADIVGGAPPLPAFAGRPYDDIARDLTARGYRRQEKFGAVHETHDVPYGQDVWTGDDGFVVRIKVGGRSINGRFPRPPHVVKEVTSTAHQYSSADIVAKMTDGNQLIPAGTKYSARDMQTWYNSNAGGHLAENAWKDPEGSGDADFSALFRHWAEGAHTAIGTVPPLPTPAGGLSAAQTAAVTGYRELLTSRNALEDKAGRAAYIVYARTSNKAHETAINTISPPFRAPVDTAITAVEDRVYSGDAAAFGVALAAAKAELQRWKAALLAHLTAPPAPRRAKDQAFINRTYSDAHKLIAAVEI